MSSSKNTSKTSGGAEQPREKLLLAKALQAGQHRRARKSLLEFTLLTCPRYCAGWFHQELAAAMDKFLRDVVAGRRPRLIIMAPPQHGKSEIVSRRFPAFALGRNPDLRIIATSHTADLAERFSTEVQRIVESDQYQLLFPQMRIASRGEAARQVDLWEVAGHRGYYRACGVGGAITGMAADILIVDDAVKDDQAASSPVVRDKIWDWFTSTAYTRLSKGGGVIVIMTRWHEDDLVGRIQTPAKCDDSDQWKILSFAALAEEDEEHRKAGEPLTVERFPLSSLLAIKQAIGSQKWAALYQQRPTPEEGSVLRRSWIRYYSASPASFDEVIQSWDLTSKDGKGSDYVAGHVWARIGAEFYLLDRVHGRMDFPTTLAAIRSLSGKWPLATTKLVEDAANASAVVQMLRGEILGLIPEPPRSGKIQRMRAVSPLFEAGNVYAPDPSLAPWVHDVTEEWVSFPTAPHDDDCDAMTQALLRLKLQPFIGPAPFIIPSRREPDLRDHQGLWITPEMSKKIADGVPLTSEEEDEMLFRGLL